MALVFVNTRVSEHPVRSVPARPTRCARPARRWPGVGLPALLGLCLGLLMAGPAWAQLSVTKTQDLSFGALVPGSTSGTVLVTAGGARSKEGGVALFTQFGTVSAAAFTVSGGPASTSCTLELPANNAVTLSRSGGGSVSLTGFTSSAVGGSLTLNGSGGGSFTVGATLNVGAGQTPGNYGPADFTVTLSCP